MRWEGSALPSYVPPQEQVGHPMPAGSRGRIDRTWRAASSPDAITEVDEDHKDAEADSSPVTTGNRDQIPRR